VLPCTSRPIGPYPRDPTISRSTEAVQRELLGCFTIGGVWADPGVYYEGWDPSRTPASYHRSKPFLDRIAADASLAGEPEASYAAAAVIDVVRHHISAGELDHVLHMLPAEVRAIARTGG
jgi:uncharacterized protein (DUF2267 family)